MDNLVKVNGTALKEYRCIHIHMRNSFNEKVEGHIHIRIRSPLEFGRFGPIEFHSFFANDFINFIIAATRH